MWLLALLAVVVIGMVIYYVVINERGKSATSIAEGNLTEDSPIRAGFARVYQRRQLLSKTEYMFWLTLTRKCGNDFIICPKVRMEDLVSVKEGMDFRSTQHYRGYIRSRHVDFVLCAANLKVLAVIELDDSSHKKKDAQRADTIKNNIFGAIGLPIFRIPVTGDYEMLIDSMLINYRPKSAEAAKVTDTID